MPRRRIRSSDVPSDVRDMVQEMTRAGVEGVTGVRLHAIHASEDDDVLAPVDKSMLRIVLDGWSASFHRSAITLLMQFSSSEKPEQAEEYVRKNLKEMLRIQRKRASNAYVYGIRTPIGDRMIPTEDTILPVHHMDGQHHEMAILMQQGGPERIREVYGRIVADHVRRRSLGDQSKYHLGSLRDIEVSARIRLSDHSALKRDRLVFDRHLPGVLTTAASGRKLGEHFEMPGLEDATIDVIENRRGNPLEEGILSGDHTSITLADGHRTNIGRWIAKHG